MDLIVLEGIDRRKIFPMVAWTTDRELDDEFGVEAHDGFAGKCDGRVGVGDHIITTGDSEHFGVQATGSEGIDLFDFR